MMRRRIRSEEQIIGILQEHEAGAKCGDLCRKHEMSEGISFESYLHDGNRRAFNNKALTG